VPDGILSRALIVCAASVLLGRQLDRGWDPLLEEFERTLSALRAESTPPDDEALRPVRALRDDVLWDRAEALFASGEEAAESRCLELFRALAAAALDPDRRSRSRRRIADLSIRRGERFEAAGDEEAALGAYLEAVDQAPDYQPGYEKVGALGISQADRQAAAQDFDGALETLAQVLERIERGLPAAHPRIGEVRERRGSILSSTGVVTLRFLGDAARLSAVRGPRTDFRQGSIRLSPLDGGAPPPVVSALEPRRVRAASYDATVTGAGGEATVTARVTVEPSGGAVTVPVAIPEGMVWVPAGGGAASFLCDRTEVSNADFDAFVTDQGGSSLGGDPRHPAAGVSIEDARRFAGWAGKELPTVAQWTHAAFGAPGAGTPRYPWGDQPGTPDVHFFGGRSGPGPVDGCPDGASAAGVLNLAGNVFEWLDDGWFIGGGYKARTFAARVNYATRVDGEASWEADFLRDKVPTLAVYENLSPDLKNKHNVYRVKAEEAASFSRQVGFRCVIPLE
jgi:tetratricopeptide (TPR) repeat protein